MKRLLACAACLAVAACAKLESGPAAAPPGMDAATPVAAASREPAPSREPASRDALLVSGIVSEALALLHAPQAERERNLANARLAFAANGNDAARLRLAVLLANLPEPLRDEAQAATLVDPLVRSGAETPIAQFGALLAVQLAERRRVARAGEKREAQMRHQLETLKAIERGVQEREERMRTKTR